MRTTYQIDFVTIAEGFDDCFVEFVAYTSIVVTPSGHVPKAAKPVWSTLVLIRICRVGP